MLRRLFTLLSALSLVLCVATSALWVRSYYYWDHCDGPAGPGGYWHLGSIRGLLCYEWAGTFSGGTTPYGNRYATPLAGLPIYRRDLGAKYAFWGFSYDPPVPPNTTDRTAGIWGVTVPHWAVALAAAGAALLCRPRRRPPPGSSACAVCGYDLRATPGRCPECGTVPAGKEA